MNTLYIICQEWQLESVRKILQDGESVGTDSYCFRPNTYVITSNYEVKDYNKAEARHDELRRALHALAIQIPMQ